MRWRMEPGGEYAPSENVGSPSTCAVHEPKCSYRRPGDSPEKNKTSLRFRVLLSRGVAVASITEWATFQMCLKHLPDKASRKCRNFSVVVKDS